MNYPSLSGITTGHDRNLWFTDSKNGKIGRITPKGTIIHYSLASHATPWGIASSKDGSLWIADAGRNTIEQVTLQGQIQEFCIPTSKSYPLHTVAAPDGNIWFTEAIGKIGKITLAGKIHEYSFPCTGKSDPTIPNGIMVEPDNNL